MNKISEKPHYQVVAGLICKGGKVLIAKRPRGSHLEGFWEFPGGKKEEGETLEQCLERELREELGISVRAEKFIARVDHEYETLSISLHLFRCAEPEEDPRPLGCESLKWVPAKDLPRHRMPPADRDFLPLLRKKDASVSSGSMSLSNDRLLPKK